MAVFVIAGFMRTGTSMMMQALEAGGMQVIHSPVRDNLNAAHSEPGYRPNPEGLYEPAIKDMRKPSWWREHDGCAIKCVVPWLHHLPVHEYRVVFMHRDIEEIRQSYRAAFPPNNGLPGPTCEEISSEIEEGLRTLRNRRDVVQVIDLHYTHVLEHPVTTFTSLKSLGWPIDTAAAASTVDANLYRFRKERLTVGL